MSVDGGDAALPDCGAGGGDGLPVPGVVPGVLLRVRGACGILCPEEQASPSPPASTTPSSCAASSAPARASPTRKDPPLDPLKKRRNRASSRAVCPAMMQVNRRPGPAASTH
ncbi:hypothetical protein BAE44_0008660 [Dichanthelium oligosanthes]|uniref:Uncharacterized protein n=1 Tax=Dichanthelium oligosanthes TaxID=888268 RepID=A0A1E5VZ06_9POAL|nr:hypothetical protein BAE44_0008660 [Dichanthelium oligosanthes]